MKVTADTNVLLRAIMSDDPEQSPRAQAELEKAELVAITLPALCELVWVLSRGYRIATHDIVETVRRLIGSANVAVNRPAVEAGLALLGAGGDFADGAIAFEGSWLGAECFLTFDQEAARLLEGRGQTVRLLR